MAKAATFRKPKTGRDSEFKQKKNANPEYIFETNRRGRKVKKKNPKYIPPTRKSDGSKLESTTSGSTKSQGTSQQEVIDNPEYQGGLKKMQTKWKKDATAKAEKLKIKGKGPVKSGEEYGKHLKEQSKKYETKGEGPVKDSKKYGKTLEAHAKKTAEKERKDWLDKTRNSPAARAGFSDKERWDLQQKHRKWKSDRKEGKLKTEKFDPRKPKGTQRKLVQKTPAEIAADRRKKEIKAAKNNKSTNKISTSVPVEKKKKKPGFDAERPGSSI